MGLPNVHAVWYPGLKQEDGDKYLQIQTGCNFTPHPEHDFIIPIDEESTTSLPPSPIIKSEQPEDMATNNSQSFLPMDLDTPYGSQLAPSDDQSSTPSPQPQPIIQQPVQQQTHFGRIIKPSIHYGFDLPAPPG
ncbi:Protein of unknown function [Pyronema omphalodes CBS 100304]|uniref:Uncharacterized protein n=1 Tax=Pyronema omphalodes (strain CBS 100304) TaxID=1076935 RepID=U4KXF7_PYROM|nr:Protein of unknown function [Pyronema omphalodes CBS 100304]